MLLLLASPLAGFVSSATQSTNVVSVGLEYTPSWDDLVIMDPRAPILINSTLHAVAPSIESGKPYFRISKSDTFAGFHVDESELSRPDKNLILDGSLAVYDADSGSEWDTDKGGASFKSFGHFGTSEIEFDVFDYMSIHATAFSTEQRMLAIEYNV
ncbi:MAG: hypothetical protein PHH26_06495, partial [Candidatus Thermoplasmatota archaeon]|nr:hypothetical protein [Candidatus Thermoplasmatota archaeon]